MVNERVAAWRRQCGLRWLDDEADIETLTRGAGAGVEAVPTATGDRPQMGPTKAEIRAQQARTRGECGDGPADVNLDDDPWAMTFAEWRG